MTDTKKHVPPFANAALVLADGNVFFGRGIGATGTTIGEICFNTAMTGYQEVLTDPSYAGQIVTFTFPHIGNVGANREDIESLKPAVAGLVVREPITRPSSFRSTTSFDDWLKQKNIVGISGIDTRALTRHIRLNGAQNAAIHYAERSNDIDLNALRHALSQAPSMEGAELAKSVSTTSVYDWNTTRWQPGTGYGIQDAPTLRVVAIDYGEKLNILRCLASFGCDITVVPPTTSAEEILKLKPHGVFLSNGPGDPAATAVYATPILKKLMAKNIPIFGICLGHQLLALALGAKTEKMHQGHRGANHPVKNLITGKVEITSQNHGFTIAHGTLPKGVVTTHISLFDGTIAGIAHQTKPLFAVQYHPEASPGPHDSLYLFEEFVHMMAGRSKTNE